VRTDEIGPSFDVGALSPGDRSNVSGAVDHRERSVRELHAGPATGTDEQLERILHPRVIARILEARKMLPDDQVLVVEAIKLVETSLRSICDRIWVVLAPRDALLTRLTARGMSEAGVAARLAAQASEDELRQAADVIFQNDGDRDALRAAVAAAWSAVRAKR